MGLFGINKLIQSKKKIDRLKLVGIVLLILLVAGMAGLYFFMSAYGMISMDLTDVVPATMVILSSVFILVFTFFRSNGFIYGAKDYNHLMSSPVSISQIVGSRLAMVYLNNLAIVIVVMVPGMILYLAHAGGSISRIIMLILVTIIMPCIPMIVAMFIGFFITFIAVRFRYRNLVSTIIQLALVIGVLVLSFGAGNLTEDMDIGEIMLNIEGYIAQAYVIANWINQSFVGENWLYLLLVMAISLVMLLVFFLILVKTYREMNTSLMTTMGRKGYSLQADSVKRSSPFQALYRKEIKRFFSSSVYILNSGIGGIMVVVAAIALIFIDLESIVVAMGVDASNLEDIVAFLPFLSFFMLGITNTTTASISLEGNQNWIMCTIPVKAMKIYLSKMAVAFTLFIPAAIIFGIAVVISQQVAGMSAVLTVIMPVVYVVFLSYLGILLNRRWPRYDWIQETDVIKNGAPTLILLLAGLIFGFVSLGLAFMFMEHIIAVKAIITVVFAIGAALLHLKLSKSRIYI
jgi:ABC-2 type transport system permease protein